MHDASTCCICSQIAGYKQNDLISQLLGDQSYSRRVILDTEDFAIIPSLGPLTPGHVLVCPRKHIKSMACLPDELERGYSHLTTKLITVLAATYDAPIHCFEHGTGQDSSRILCTVEHAHLHFIPAAVSVWETLHRDMEWLPLDSTLRGLHTCVGGSEYLFYRSPDGRCIVHKPAQGGVESQYLRKVLATALGRPNSWDWRESPHPDHTDAIYRQLRSAFAVDSTTADVEIHAHH